MTNNQMSNENKTYKPTLADKIYKTIFMVFAFVFIIYAIYRIAWFFGPMQFIEFKIVSLFHKYDILSKYPFAIEKEIDLSKQGNKFEMNISVADSGFYRFGLGYTDKKELKEEYMKIYDEIHIKYFSEPLFSNPKAKNFNYKFKLKKDYTYEEYYKEQCDRLPLQRIYGDLYHSSDYALECKPSQIILKFQIIPHDDKNIIKQYTDGKNRDMYAVLDYNGKYPFEMICDTTKVYSGLVKAFDKKCFAVGLYKGDYKVLVETLSDTPETAQILTLFVAERDRYGKMNEFENELK